MQRECDICGTEDDERWMYRISSGRKTEWYCHECYKNLQREATQSDFYRQKKLRKIHESSKRNK